MKPLARPSLLETSPLITVLSILSVLAVLIRVVREVPELGADGVVVDFDAFYIAGQMVWEGTLLEAYDPAVTQARQSALAGGPIFMPWSYPPQFDLVVALLPLGSRGTSYAVFMLLSFALFLWPLYRLSGRYFPAVLFASIPTLGYTTICGQNGFLTAGLLGFVALAWLRGSDRAGIPLGLMVIKPHLALGIGLLALVTPRWRVVVWAGAVVVLSSALATLAFGPSIWQAFLDGTAAAKANMALGRYPLHRMTSVYAALHSLQLGPSLALAVHLGVALVALGTILWLARFSGWTARRIFGLSLLLSLAISPYNYDYDMPIMSMGLALLAADLIEHGRVRERICLAALAWASGGAGLALSPPTQEVGVWIYGETWFPVSLGAYAFLPLVALTWRILHRVHLSERQEAAWPVASSPSFSAR